MPKSGSRSLIRLGESIRQRREALQLSQEEVGFDAGLDRSYLSQLESGRRNPSYDLLLRIAKALRVRLQDLLPDEE